MNLNPGRRSFQRRGGGCAAYRIVEIKTRTKDEEGKRRKSGYNELPD